MLIHPYDKTTLFLKRVANFLGESKYVNSHYFQVKCSDRSHLECLQRVNSLPDEALIVFMGHGRSDALIGSKSDDYGLGLISDEAVSAFPEKYYYKERFIENDTLKYFAKKRFLSLSCNSNGKIGKMAIQNGVSGFIGFGDLPSSIDELEDIISNDILARVSKERVIGILKGYLVFVLKMTIETMIIHGYNFSDIPRLVRMIVNKLVIKEVSNKRKHLEKEVILLVLQNFKSNISYSK